MSPALTNPIQRQLEDPLSDLRGSTVRAYHKHQTIYEPDQRSSSIYLVVEGTVKVSRLLPGARRQTIVDIYQPGEFFGESAILELDPYCEQATALAAVRLKIWTAAALDEIVMHDPRVAMAISRILVRRMIHFNERIESFSADTIPRRLARALIRFSGRLGKPEDQGWVSMPAFTHGLLGEYIGTDREIVSICLNEFRRQGYLRYSRTILTLHGESLQEFLRQKAASRSGETRRRAAQPLRAVQSNYNGAQALPQPS